MASSLFPLIRDFRLLKKLQEHPHAPRYNFESGDRLTRPFLNQVERYQKTLESSPLPPNPGEVPEWVEAFTQFCVKEVPFYQGRKKEFLKQPSIRRQDLAAAPWNFVPRKQPLDDLLVFATSGTTGPAMSVYSHPVTAATYLPVLQKALALRGLRLEGGKNRVSIALVFSQKHTRTYASLSTYLRGAGILKLNWNESDWKSAEDPMLFLEDCDPEVLSGTPLSLLKLAQTDAALHPKALFTSAMSLLPKTQKILEKRFRCPVLDLYSLSECRLLSLGEKDGHRLLRPDVHVEILDPRDLPLPPGQIGEIALTGGNNPYLPLLRYRTGDFGSLRISKDAVFLSPFHGRTPLEFENDRGGKFQSIDLAQALCPFSFGAYSLKQAKDLSLTFEYAGTPVDESVLKAVLRTHFGKKLRISIRFLKTLKTEKLVSFEKE